MDTNTNDLAKALANAVLTTVSLDDFKAEMTRRGLRVDNPCDCVPERLTDDQVLEAVRARGLVRVVNNHVTDEWLLEQLAKRDLTGDVLEAADDDELWEAIENKTYTVTSNMSDLDDGDVLDALDEYVKDTMCRGWVKDYPDEARRALGESDEKDDEWVVGEVFRRGLAGDVLRDIADKMRLTY